MNWKPLVLGLVLLDFAAFTLYAVMQHGYVGFFELAMANSATQLMFFDLCIALSLFTIWMWSDARQRSIGFWPPERPARSVNHADALEWQKNRYRRCTCVDFFG